MKAENRNCKAPFDVVLGPHQRALILFFTLKRLVDYRIKKTDYFLKTRNPAFSFIFLAFFCFFIRRKA
ncbi:hypothetical protein B5F35_03995 [Anaeromassilibacillus sp. An200]|nr:hypothetical protein B5F35_03995 [Anaeromassilibacillus sp. An200]